MQLIAGQLLIRAVLSHLAASQLVLFTPRPERVTQNMSLQRCRDFFARGQVFRKGSLAAFS